MDPAQLQQFLEQFQDHLAPRLDTYEQALYLYIFRHGRLLGVPEVVIGFKSARKRMATGIGEAGKPMSEGTCYKKLQSLASKGLIEVRDSRRDGSQIYLRLPSEIPGAIPTAPPLVATIKLEDVDFFSTANRVAIFQRENGKCFYCLRDLNSDNWLVEHVRSRPEGDSTYRNVVAACRSCNNRKGSLAARDFLRDLVRGGRLSDQEFDSRLAALDQLEKGDLRPSLP